MQEEEIEDKVKKKTLSTFLQNTNDTKDFTQILKFMSSISKNIYNTTVYIYSIYLKYKEPIFSTIKEEIMTGEINDNEKLTERIYQLFQYFLNLSFLGCFRKCL